jgi:hypothetical protein
MKLLKKKKVKRNCWTRPWMVTHLHQNQNKCTCNIKHIWFFRNMPDFSNINAEKLVVAWEEEEDL